MRYKPVFALLFLALAGCVTSPESKKSWEVKPALDVRHGMSNGAAYYQMGRYHQEQGDNAAAESAFNKAIAVDPKNIDALNALGAIYGERGELERAAAMYWQVAEQAPRRAYLFNNIGYALYLQKRLAEALDAFKKAVSLDPGYERAWVNLQKAALAANMPELAALAERHVLTPAPSESAAALARADSLSGTQAIAGKPADQPKTPESGGLDVPLLVETGTVQEQAKSAVSESGGAAENKLPRVSATIVASQNRQQGAIRLTEVSAAVLPQESIVRVGTTLRSPSDSKVLLTAAKPGEIPTVQAAIAKGRLEVSNGNGVSGFARRIRSMLTNDGMPVSRMTNFNSYSVPKTIIEYRAGYAEQAHILRAKLAKPVTLRQASTDRPGTDLRLILGADWLRPYRVLSESEFDLLPLV